MRIDPPVSVPTEAKHIPEATDATEPPLDPPEIRLRAQGLWTGPKWGFSLVMP